MYKFKLNTAKYRTLKTLIHVRSLSPLLLILAALAISCNQHKGGEAMVGEETSDGGYVLDDYGAIIRGDLSEKNIALVFTGDTFADGGATIIETLRQRDIRASFFFTGNFYANPAFRQLIVDLKEEAHYLGAHSDKHLLYADWSKRDSLLVTEEEFKEDLLSNYKKMESFDIRQGDARWFLPPYEWYNATIARWTRDLGFVLVNFSPGTKSAADYTFPEMGERYVSSEVIYESILNRAQADPHGLNGFILLVHIGSDPRRTDKFYNKLGLLLTTLKSDGYNFVTIDELLET